MSFVRYGGQSEKYSPQTRGFEHLVPVWETMEEIQLVLAEDAQELGFEGLHSDPASCSPSASCMCTTCNRELSGPAAMPCLPRHGGLDVPLEP